MPTYFFTLLPREGKRLIGRAVAAMAPVRQALTKGRLIIAGGTTNAYVLEELSGKIVNKGAYTAGVITGGEACLTVAETRIPPAIFIDGEEVDQPWTETLQNFGHGDVFIKGANAIDLDGNAGVLLGASNGGTIGQAMGHLAASGACLLIPVGLEKLVPDVRAAASILGRETTWRRRGMGCGMFVISTGTIVTEIEALALLFEVDTTVVAAGGVAGSEGALTLVAEGSVEAIEKLSAYVAELKTEPAFTVDKRVCSTCPDPCERGQ